MEQGVNEDADKGGGSHGCILKAEQGVNEDAVKGGECVAHMIQSNRMQAEQGGIEDADKGGE